MLLSGVHYITVAPKLLRELASTDIDAPSVNLTSFLDKMDTDPQNQFPLESYLDKEEMFRMAVTRDSDGVSEGKIGQVSAHIVNVYHRLRVYGFANGFPDRLSISSVMRS